MHKTPFLKNSLTRATKRLELVHTDVCGPINIDSAGGSKYILTFTDNCMRYVIAYFIKSKAHMLTKFKEYVALMGYMSNGHHLKTI